MERTIPSWSEASHCHPTLIGFDHSVSSILEVGKLSSKKLTGTFAGEPFVGRGFHTNSTNQYSVWSCGGATTLIDFNRSVSHIFEESRSNRTVELTRRRYFIQASPHQS
jgi:hypothetical protein